MLTGPVLVSLSGEAASQSWSSSDRPWHANERWYIGGGLGLAVGDQDEDAVQDDLDDAGIEGTVESHETDRLGYRIFGGYRYSNHLGFELGYVDLGDLETELEVRGGTSLHDVGDSMAYTGQGFEASVVGYWPLTERLELHGRAGLWRWRDEQKMAGETRQMHGDELHWAWGGRYRFSERWAAQTEMGQYFLDDQSVTLYGVGLTYYFDEQSAPRSQSAPAPETADSGPERPLEVAERQQRSAVPIVLTPSRDTIGQYWFIRFDTARAELRDDAEPILEQIAERQQDLERGYIAVEGHADTRGPVELNQLLSEQRADAVVAALAERGVPEARMAGEGFGEERPLSDERDPNGYQKDRRASVRLVKDLVPSTAAAPDRWMVHFETASDAIDRPYTDVLEQVAEEYHARPDSRLMLKGHTDTRGSSAINQALARQRVEKAREELLANGVPAEAIETADYGEKRPIADEAEPLGYARNRRVEVALVEGD